ncbi:MAG: SdpI family protein [Bacteroidota bacterium]
MDKILKNILWPVIFAPVVYLAIIWKQLPDTIAVHFDLHGHPDRYGSKKELFGVAAALTVMNILIYFLLTNIHRIDPKKHAVENKSRLLRIAFALAVFMSAILILIIYSSMKGSVEFSISVIFAGVGLLFAVIGNYMVNIKPNYFAGFRVPWALENADNWRKTHLLAGRLWFAGGLFLAIICLFLPPVAAIIVFFTVTIVITVIPFVYSYRLYKEQKKGAGN